NDGLHRCSGSAAERSLDKDDATNCRRHGTGPGETPGPACRSCYRCSSRKVVSCDFEMAPTLVASTLPSLNNMSVGMPRIPNFGGVLGFSSILSLAIFSLPS